ncbi:MAG: hypothetical protein G01um1014106_511 [Parcubacteria group bacterium Gr01-1014_106]|nr:MAG: hypothetical protein G01um1014106_511 [Parcubacteria group bacterium Gr01-1014_106]
MEGGSDNTTAATRIPFCTLAELQEQKKITKWVDAFRDEITALSLNGEILVTSSVCLHMGGAFDVDWQTKCFRCRWHAWEFDIKSGACQTFSLAGRQLRHYQFVIEDHQIILPLPDDARR